MHIHTLINTHITVNIALFSSLIYSCLNSYRCAPHVSNTVVTLIVQQHHSRLVCYYVDVHINNYVKAAG